VLQQRSPAEVHRGPAPKETRQFVRRLGRVTVASSPLVLEGFRREVRVSELCRGEGIRPNIY
jgi:hypothetical protein